MASLTRQATFVALGAGCMAVTALVDHRRVRALAPLLYAGSLALLVAVLSPLGTRVKGAQSWFSLGSLQVQPAELAKVATIVALAAYCADRRHDLGGRRLLGALVLAGIPLALVLAQPDLGSAIVYAAIAVGVLVVAGARARDLAVLALVGGVAVVGVLQLDLLEGYQRDRLTAFATEGSSDRQGASFQLTQARATIAAGGLLGTGMFEGTQTKLGFVPEQQTDFIFTVVGEELGFVGSVTLLGLYGVVAWRLWRIGVLAGDRFGTLVATGVLSMLVFHLFQNLGMAMGIMPITGIPLPLMSAGGSATVATFVAVGIVLNVHLRGRA
jgi:rod shape determining protein RodA